MLTGETGAGKSMILGALDVLLGARCPKDAVAESADRAIIEGEFHLSDLPGLTEKLFDAEVELGDDLIVRREIAKSGRGRIWLDDRPASLETMLRIRDRLADFHGQREQQSLFDPHRQIEYLDAFAGSSDLARDVAGLFIRRVALKRDLEQAKAALESFQRDRALLAYQLEEIARLGLKAGEEETLEARLRKLESLERLAEESARLADVLSESDPSLESLAGTSKNVAAAIAKTDPDLSSLAEELSVIASRIKDVAAGVRRYRDGLTLDEGELNKLRERRSLLWELRRKHGMTVEQILARADQMKERIAEGESREQAVHKMEDDLRLLSSELIERARDLSDRRSRSAKRFCSLVVKSLKPLGFDAPDFRVDIQTIPEPLDAERISAEGADRVEFLFSANPGKAAAPIQHVASGGESSRVTLAIKSVLSDKADYPLMIYDEIDIGISGRVADQVGRALSELAGRHQLLVITHLPQIASRADHHLLIEKKIRGAITETSARFLHGKERVQGVAMLMAGEKITERSLASASELLQQQDPS
ncbi:DNA repair protein RecN [bacterium]|nr:DNA repair protein RecN [bacterium]